MFWRTNCVGVCTLLALGTGGPSAQSVGLKAVMRDKLDNTQRLLEAVVRADTAGIARYAEPLSHITETEIASWQTAAQAEYTKHATVFLLSVNGLREAAAGKNIDAATLEYTSLVSSCIGCHRYIQRAKPRVR